MVESNDMPASRHRTRFMLAATVLLSIASIIVVVMVINAVRTCLLAEQNLQAFLHAYRATLQHVQENDGQWPRSWGDLRTAGPESNFDSVAERVAFDFEADPRKIVSQNPATFTAIEPHEPCCVIDDHVQQLIDTLAKYTIHTSRPLKHG